jgi:alpha-ketoglutarate-dependent taurine dioxygenase
MTSTPIADDPRAWRVDTIDPPDNWYYPLSNSAVSSLEEALRESRPASVTDLHASDRLRSACARDLSPVHEALETGRGFAIITPGPRFAPRDLPAIYWLLGELLGQPFEQNVQGTLLYDVRDTGQDVRYGARFSVTNADATFHTDNSFGETVLDYVGLLCLNSAKSGGLSQIVSGYAVQDELMAQNRKAWDILCRPFHVDRRGGVRPGEEPTARVPVFGTHTNDLLVRYLRYWIEVGHEKAGAPLTAEQVSALDTLDQVAAEPRLRVEFMLRPGEMLFENNRWLLHNRTAFEDHSEPERKRHYVRLWLRRANQ